jgi:DNA-binding transcriptional ArsR family regulator
MMAIPSNDELELLHSNICYAVADVKRIQILYALHEQPRHVSALAELLDTPQPTTSRHLTILRERGLVVPERAGNIVVYRLADSRIIDVLNTMRDMLRKVLARKTNIMTSLPEGLNEQP